MNQTLPDEPLPDTPPPAVSEDALALLVIPDEPPVRVDDLLPVASILDRVKGLPAVINAAARAQMLDRMATGLRVTDADTRKAADAVRDMCKQHERAVEAFFTEPCSATNSLHKGMTGLRSFAMGNVVTNARTLGDAMALSIRLEEAEKARVAAAERDRLAQEAREALRAESERNRLEAERLTAEAELVKATTGDNLAAAMIEEQAREAQLASDRALVDAVTATGGPVTADVVETAKGAVTSDNWQALPEHAETPDDLPQRDLVALVRFVAARLAENDLAPLALLAVDWKAAKALAKAQKGLMKVPGLRAVNPPKYSKRTTR